MNIVKVAWMVTMETQSMGDFVHHVAVIVMLITVILIMEDVIVTLREL